MLQTKNFMKFLQHYSHYVCGTLNSSHTFTLTSCGARVSLQTHLVCRPIEFSKRRLNRGLLVLFHIYSCLRTSCTKVCVCSARNFYFVSICQTVGSQDCFQELTESVSGGTFNSTHSLIESLDNHCR